MLYRIIFLVATSQFLATSVAFGQMGYWGWKNNYYRDVGNRKQLFIDDAIIEELEVAERVLHQADFYEDNPVVQSDQPWEGDLHIEQYGSVLYDEEESIFKMWYQVLDWDRTVRMLAYATSKDGLHWNKPKLGTVDFRGSVANNFVFGPPRPPSREEVEKDPTLKKAFDSQLTANLAPAGEPIKDIHERDPTRRYKLLYRGPPYLAHYMVNAAYSPDGIHWTPEKKKNGPVIPLRSDSSNNVFWDPRIDRYVAILRLFQPFGEQRLSSYPRIPDTPLMRVVGRSVSRDFVNWSPAEVILSPDEQDGLDHGQLHDMEVMLYEGYYIGLMGVMHKDTESYAQLSKDVQLAVSRDGVRWSRPLDRRAIIPLKGHESITVLQAPLVVGDKIYIFYTGLEAAYHPNSMPAVRRSCVSQAVGLAILRLDGFVSVDAGPNDAVLTTENFVFRGEQLQINADASAGQIEVEILACDNQYDSATVDPVPGFTRMESAPISSDRTEHVVSWKNGADVSGLQDKVVKLKFYMRNAKLFSFQFTDE